MKLMWYGTQLELTVDELEDMYTRGLLGTVKFSDATYSDIVASYLDRTREKNEPTIFSDHKHMDGLYEELQPTKVQASSVEESIEK